MEISLLTTLTAAQTAVNGIPIIGEEGVAGAQFAGALRGWVRELIGRKTLVETQRLIRETG